MASSIEAIQKILQETVAPGISDIRERVSRIEVEIKRLDDKIDNGLARLDGKVDSVRNELLSEIRRVDQKIDLALNVHERLAVLEAKIALR